MAFAKATTFLKHGWHCLALLALCSPHLGQILLAAKR
jgi:hypothetical protein